MKQLPSFERSYKQEILHWLEKEPDLIIMLWGPRQSGKTTLILQVLTSYPGASQYINVDDYRERQAFTDFPYLQQLEAPLRIAEWMMSHWDRARMKAKETGKPFVLVIDEVQKIDDWSRRIKGMWDRDRRELSRVHVVLLGSSPHLLQKGLSESLCGRFYEITSPHWNYSEMSQAFGFSLNQFIYYGGYPGAAKHIQQHQQWKQFVERSIINTNLGRDVLGLMDIENPELMKRLYYLGSRSSGQILNYQKITAQGQGGSQALLSRYLSALKEVHMLAGLSCYAQSHHRRSGAPKFQVLNTALMSAAYDGTFEQAQKDHEYWGRLVESAVGAHIFNTANMLHRNVYYWRYDNLEVDFVVELASKLVAIEVKSGKKTGKLQGLKKFQERFPQAHSLLIGTGGISLEEFFSKPAEYWLTGQQA